MCDIGAKDLSKHSFFGPTSSTLLSGSDLLQLENLSVSEILDLTFSRTRKKCIQFGTGAWWVYELCPGQYIRQYHEVTLLDRVSGLSTTAIETQHILGRFNQSARRPSKEEDWKHVVNMTSPNIGAAGNPLSNAPTNHGGNGAFFAQEYTGGDICDHQDVTDSAIKAGEVGEGRIERSTTVKYGCGNHIEMSVKEDTTCHYVINVNIPALCHHPLFRPPTSRKQFVKCLAEDF